MKKMMFLSKNWYFSVQKALIYYTVNKSYHNSFILLVFSHVANFRYVANFRFLTLNAQCKNCFWKGYSWLSGFYDKTNQQPDQINWFSTYNLNWGFIFLIHYDLKERLSSTTN